MRENKMMNETPFHLRSPDGEPSPEVGEVLYLADLVLRLGAQERITADPEGRPESVTTHTMMLALVCSLFLRDPRHQSLRPALTLMYALVHDLPEAIAGDTPTLRPLTPEERAGEDGRERAAVEDIRRSIPSIAALIDSYERQDTPEARFVHLAHEALSRLSELTPKEHERKRLDAQVPE